MNDSTQRSVLLTGSTGLVGQRLMWGLLRAGHPVTVLVRPSARHGARDRVGRVLDDWQRRTGTTAASPDVVEGDVRVSHFGLPPATYARLCRSIHRVLHCAASVTFQPDQHGDPDATNVIGTAEVLRFCQAAGVADLHHVSTAYVCGRREGLVREDELDVGQSFRNAYEKSKLSAEKMVRNAEAGGRLKATVYRPGIVVGDSRTGHTPTFHGLYSFYRIGQVLSRVGDKGPDGLIVAPVRVAADADQRRNFVPVDYVADALLWIFQHADLHGRTVHLTHPDPPTLAVVRDVIERHYSLRAFEFVGPSALPLPDASSFEELFYAETRAYRDYLSTEPRFDRTAIDAALEGSGIRCPALDRDRMGLLLDYAVKANWGRNGRSARRSAEGADCRDYFERFLPEALPASQVARTTAFDVDVAFEIDGPGGGRWLCRFRHGRLDELLRGSANGQQVTYTTDVDTFHSVVGGVLPYQQAFLSDRIAIDGDMETALKLGAIFARFTRECPYRAPTRISSP